MNRYRVKQSNR
jgi:hypothetical protein